MDKKDRPKVGIGVMIFKKGKVLLGKRKGSHGEGYFASPGGHLESGQTFDECAKIETKEETGIEIKNIKFHFIANLKNLHGKHYVHIQLSAEWKSGQPEVLEPEKCEGWEWYPADKLPKPIFETEKIFWKNLKSGKFYIED